MPIFIYKGLNAAGASARGEIDAADRKRAIQKLETQGIRPLSVRALDDSAEQEVEIEDIDFFKSQEKGRPAFLSRKSKNEIALSFLQRTLTLLQSGMPLGDTMKLLCTRLTDPKLNEIATTAWRRMSEGGTLAGAMREMPETFSESTVHLVEAGESSGNLSAVLSRVTIDMSANLELKRKVSSSLAYPMFILLVAIGVIIFFLLFLLPKIRSILTDLGGEMPFFTKALLWMADMMVAWGPIALAALVFGTLFIAQWRKSPKGRRMTDFWGLRAPVFGKIFLYNSVLSASSLMSTLMGSGINTTEALRLVEKAISNSVLRLKFSAARKQIQEGVSISGAFKKVHFMPDIAMDILTVGENTGNIVGSLQDINRLYRDDLTRTLNTLTGVITVGALIGVFAFIALIAIGVITAVLSVNQSISNL